MAEMIEVRYDASGLRDIERQVRHIPQGLKRIVPPAINRSVATMRTAVARDIRTSGLNQGVGRIKRHLWMRRASASKWSGRLEVAAKRYDLARDFGAKDTRPAGTLGHWLTRHGGGGGVTVKVMRTRVTLPQAFIPRADRAARRAGHEFLQAHGLLPSTKPFRMWYGFNSVVMRRPQGGGALDYLTAQTRRPLVGRTPMIKVKGPSLVEIWSKTPGIIEAARRRAPELLRKELLSKVNWLLQRRAS